MFGPAPPKKATDTFDARLKTWVGRNCAPFYRRESMLSVVYERGRGQVCAVRHLPKVKHGNVFTCTWRMAWWVVLEKNGSPPPGGWA
jgi:hypothetical protein